MLLQRLPVRLALKRTTLGVSPFVTARDTYYDKLNIVSAIDDDDSWVQKEVGTLLEDLVAKIFHVKT